MPLSKGPLKPLQQFHTTYELQRFTAQLIRTFGTEPTREQVRGAGQYWFSTHSTLTDHECNLVQQMAHRAIVIVDGHTDEPADPAGT